MGEAPFTLPVGYTTIVPGASPELLLFTSEDKALAEGSPTTSTMDRSTEESQSGMDDRGKGDKDINNQGRATFLQQPLPEKFTVGFSESYLRRKESECALLFCCRRLLLDNTDTSIVLCGP